METSEDAQTPLYSSFNDVIGIIFNNWTAIKLAVEHGMGGTPASTHYKLTGMIEAAAQTLASGSADWYDLSDLLAELVDTEFSTILEDNSSDEVANHLCQLHEMFRVGDHAGVHAALTLLPVRTPINATISTARAQQTDSSDDDEEDQNPPEDDGWTVVKRK